MDFSKAATTEELDRVAAAARSRGITVEVVANGAEALARVRAIIPKGASVSTGASLTLKEIGLEALLTSPDHPWRNLKGEYLAEKDPQRQTLLRRQSTLADWYLGSAHAVAQTGELVFGSLTGSQLSPYAYAASNVIWIVGAQKVTPDLETAIRRLREYVLPHEDKRMREATGGKMGSGIGKMLVFEREAPFLKRTVMLILSRENLGD